MSKAIVSREQDYSQWYNEIVIKAGLADYSAVKGCMVIKPYGYAIWERMQRVLDDMFKETGHSNAYFPMMIPKSFFSKEASHVEGFAKECAVVTHYRLKNSPEGIVVDETAKLEEELILRPTSETIIWNTYKGWIQSYRDLPLLINQWANVVRWEMRTRLFLRTTEFLWQEGHTAHATAQEAVEETLRILDIYTEFSEKWMSMPVIKGVKSANERFAGAVDTYCIESLMQDGKALQSGTSHFLGQNFAKAFDVKYLNKEGKSEFVWATSWGVSTRLMGALVMTHSDDEGLVLPPMLAPHQVVIVPIYREEEQHKKINEVVTKLKKEFITEGIRVLYDESDNHSPGWKFAEYELKGVPVRLAIGPKDLEKATVEVYRRDLKKKEFVPIEGITAYIKNLLVDIQKSLYEKALDFRAKHTHKADDYTTFKEIIDSKEGGFVLAHWDGTAETEEKIKEETKATIRCIPMDGIMEEGKCIYSGKPSRQRVIFAKAY
jgi:prolyl-tRNA synthetase